MDLTKQFPVSREVAEKGAWIKSGEASFHLSYQGSAKVAIQLETRTQTNVLEGMDPIDAAIKAMDDTLAEDVLLGWKNLKEDGKPIKHSKENALKAFADHEGFAQHLMNLAAKVEEFVVQKEEGIQGN